MLDNRAESSVIMALAVTWSMEVTVLWLRFHCIENCRLWKGIVARTKSPRLMIIRVDEISATLITILCGVKKLRKRFASVPSDFMGVSDHLSSSLVVIVPDSNALRAMQ